MFEFKDNRSPPVKAFVTEGDLPNYIEPGQMPRTKKPFSTILQQSFTLTVGNQLSLSTISRTDYHTL